MSKTITKQEELEVLNQVPADDFDFDSYDDDLIESGGIPHCQIKSPIALDPTAIKSLKLSPEQVKEIESIFGVLIPKDKAEEVNFQPDSNWELGDWEVGDATVEGYLAKHFRCVIVHRSGMEVQEKVEKGWRFLGMGYENGKPTRFNDLAEADKQRDTYRRVSRLLLFFLGENNELLHEAPLQLTAKGAFSGSFGKELTEVRRSLDKCFFKAARAAGKPKSGSALGDRTHAFTIMDCTIGSHKEEKKNPSAFISSRLEPAIEKVGTVEVVYRGTEVKKAVSLHLVDWKSLIIPSKSATGQAIAEAYETYIDFPKPNRGRSSDTSTEGSGGQQHSFFGVGCLTRAPEVKFEEDGSVHAGFEFEFARGNATARQWCEVSGEDAERLANDWTVQGLKVSGVFTVEGRWNDGKPVVQVDAIEFPDPSAADDDLNFDD